MFPYIQQYLKTKAETAITESLRRMSRATPVAFRTASQIRKKSEKLSVGDPHENLSDLAALARQWLSQCSCAQTPCFASSSKTQRPPLPTRVLDVGNNGESTDRQDIILSLYESEPEETGHYVTLSYCWGESPNTARTTKETLHEFQKEIPWKILPKTIQDAVAFVRLLGVRYLWIDALCIIQADVAGAHSDDFEREAVRMGAYYGNAICTVAAAAASDSSQGMLQRRLAAPFPRTPISLHTTHTVEEWQMDIHVDPLWPSYKTAISNSILLGRGWVTQELEFSPRILFFSRNCLAWRCRTGWRWEDGSSQRIGLKRRAYGCRHCEDAHRTDIDELVNSFLEPDDGDSDGGLLPSQGTRWLKFVEQYSQTHFSQLRDRLIALSSLASHIKHDSTSQFVGGIWRDEFLQGLTWFINSSEASEPHAIESHAPSWSWASVAGAVHFVPQVEIHKSYTTVEGLMPLARKIFMPGANSLLRVRGLVGQLDLLRHSVRRFGEGFKRWKPFGHASATQARCWQGGIDENKHLFRDIRYHGAWKPAQLVLDSSSPRNRFRGDMPGPFICIVLFTHRNFFVPRVGRELYAEREDAICLLLERATPNPDLQAEVPRDNTNIGFYRRIGIVELQYFKRNDLADIIREDIYII
ncbi:heterokaryon incompatibility protein-domain-containing protein [Xylaria digitata]|nr:heterokaryon incompatibility protein-domain-containing protein [Xylaria digitata]